MTNAAHHAHDVGSLDHHYWDTDASTKEIAEVFGIPRHQIHRRVTPRAAGVACHWCSAPLVYGSRAGRLDHRIACRSCGATRRNPLHRASLPVRRPRLAGGVLAVRVPPPESAWDPGRDIDRCIAALAAAGIAWDERSLVVVPPCDGSGDDVLTALHGHDPGVLAVVDLRTLAATQTERLQVLFQLTRAGWRVVSGRDHAGEVEADEYRWDDFARLDEPVDHAFGSPTHAQRLVLVTSNDDVARSRLGRGWEDERW